MAPLYLERDGHRTWLKWHRARRCATDPVFTPRRILEGLRLGASIEVDLVVHGDRGFAVLHDLTLERETTGEGRVVDTGAQMLRRLRLRDNDGMPIEEPVMLLEDLADLLGAGGLHEEALLQLDFKEDAAALDARAIAAFGAASLPVARHMILSSGDAEAVGLLSREVEGLRIGYDPCHGEILERLRQSRDFPGFVAETLAASPQAELIYLSYELVLDAERLGFDLVEAFHGADRRIDAYTIKSADAGTRPLIQRLLALKVDQITTDDPEGVKTMMEVGRNG